VTSRGEFGPVGVEVVVVVDLDDDVQVHDHGFG
jgi:hypothetical protein